MLQRRPQAAVVDRYRLPAEPTAANPVDQWDGQAGGQTDRLTDIVPLHRPAGYYASGVHETSLG